jgi:hypothetical protein
MARKVEAAAHEKNLRPQPSDDPGLKFDEVRGNLGSRTRARVRAA